MAYDDELADRLRAALSGRTDVREKRMFGGLAFRVDGAMAVAVSGAGGLMVRCDPARTAELLAVDGVGPMVMQGRELIGWVRVSAEAVEEEDVLRRWVAIGCDGAAQASGPARSR